MKHHLFHFSKGNSINNDVPEDSKQYEETIQYPRFDTKECQVKLRDHLLHAEGCYGKLQGHLISSPVIHRKHP